MRFEAGDNDRGAFAGGPGLTRLGSIIGTPAYIAPEQAAGRAVDGRRAVLTRGDKA